MSEKVALVTGGIGGIGTQVCKRLYAQGRRVVAGYLPDEEAAAIEWQRARRLEQRTGKEPPVYFLQVYGREGETDDQAIARTMKENGFSYSDLAPGQVLFRIVI